ncbi:MAG: ABC-2 family transporter protein [Lentisphaerota bacterium]
MGPYFQIAKLRLLTALTYRFEVVTGVASSLIMMAASVFLWKTVYRGIGSAAAVDQQQMVTYAIISVFLGAIFVTGVQGTITRRIRRGEIAIDFIRPISLLGSWLAEDAGGVLSALAVRFLPLLVLAGLFFGLPLPASRTALPVFLVSCLFSFGILWLLSALSGMLAFWTIEIGHMGLVKDTLVWLMSGGVVPIWFFPEWFQALSRYLPFIYTYQTPLAIYIGRTPVREAAPALAVQFFWLILLGVLVRYVWHCGHRRVMVQGG